MSEVCASLWKLLSNSNAPVKKLPRETNNGSDSINGESKDQIIINLTNNFVENKEEASHGSLMAKVSISILLLMISVILFQFQ